jgi:hypothetical protein
MAWLIIMGSAFDNWVYWHFFTVTQLQQLTNWTPEQRLSDEFLWRISHCTECRNKRPFITATRPEYVKQLVFLCYFICCHGNLVFGNLLSGNDSFVAIRCSGSVISEPLLSNRCPVRLYRSGFQLSCHNMFSILDKTNEYETTVTPRYKGLNGSVIAEVRNNRAKGFSTEVQNRIHSQNTQ